MKAIDDVVVDELVNNAHLSERKRAHYLLHTSHQDKVQRLIITMVKGSYVEPHFHELPNQWELFLVLKGVVEFCLYDDSGSFIKKIFLGPEQFVQIIEIKPLEIHSVKCISDVAVMLEIKEGPFDEKKAKVLTSW